MSNYRVIAPSGCNIRGGAGTDSEIVGTLATGQVVISPDITGWTPISLEDNSIGWVKAILLEPAPAGAPAVPAVLIPSTGGEPPSWLPWIAMARKYLGTKESPGSADNPTIVGWDDLMTTLPASMRHDATPWCAIFVHAMLLLGGYKGKIIESALAVDWLKFGVPVADPKVGDIVVFDFGGGDHHVAFVLSVSGGLVHVIGGNQSDAVTLASYGAQYVMGYRRAA